MKTVEKDLAYGPPELVNGVAGMTVRKARVPGSDLIMLQLETNTRLRRQDMSEDDWSFFHHVNSKEAKWTQEETDRFWEILRRCGRAL